MRGVLFLTKSSTDKINLKPEMNQNPSKQIAFVAVSEWYHFSEERLLTDEIWVKSNHIVFVSPGELSKIDFGDKYFRQTRLMGTCPGCASHIWQARFKRGDNTRFETGMYYSCEHLLFIDDVIAWSHHRIEFKKIRNALDIAKETRRK